MSSVRWRPEGIDSLERLDEWRERMGWDPIGSEIVSAISAFLVNQRPTELPYFVPGRFVRTGVAVWDGLRVATVTVRSKPFRVFFQYHVSRDTFDIVQVLHPRALGSSAYRDLWEHAERYGEARMI